MDRSQNALLAYRSWPTYALAPGSIIHALHVCEVLEPSYTLRSDGRRRSDPLSMHTPKELRKLMAKMRTMIVVNVFESHFVCVGVYTRGGRGISGVPEGDKRHYTSIKDHRSEKFELQTPERPVLYTEELIREAHIIAPRGIVHFNAPITLWKMYEFAILGRLTADSTADLLQLCRGHAPKSALECEKDLQRAWAEEEKCRKMNGRWR